ncbi:MAG TPA: hypothetical protein VGM67_08030 [Gemmatimonadaceae bacterium]|jgi:hypothetical protein
MIDTKSFMVGAYTVATVIYVLYMLSLWNRARRVSKALDSAGARNDR